MVQYSLRFWISVVLKLSATVAVSIRHLQKILKTNLLMKSNTSTADFRLGGAYGDRRDMSPLRERGHLAPVTLGGHINRIQRNSNQCRNRLSPPDRFDPTWSEKFPTAQDVCWKLKKIFNRFLLIQKSIEKRRKSPTKIFFVQTRTKPSPTKLQCDYL